MNQAGETINALDDGSQSQSARTPPPSSQAALALLDLVQGARAFRLWGLLAWQDVRQHYRRSSIGPFWITISMGIMVMALGLLFSTVFNTSLADYMPFLATGLVVWSLMASLVNDGCRAFVDAESIVKQINLPLSTHGYRVACRALIIFAHNLLILAIIAWLFPTRPGWVALLAAPGLALLCLNGVWACLLFGLVSARFRDVPLITANLMQVSFFLTPVFWRPEALPERAALLQFNPFYHFLELVRAPLLGQAPGMVSWLVATGIALAGWLVMFIFYCRCRQRIAYWL